MTGKTGYELGVELGRLWNAGKHDLPKVADDYWSACTSVPTYNAPACSRGGGLGSDPGSSIDDYAGRVYKMLLETRTSVSAVADALVWIADEYAKTDESCRQAFNATKTEVDGQ